MAFKFTHLMAIMIGYEFSYDMLDFIMLKELDSIVFLRINCL